VNPFEYVLAPCGIPHPGEPIASGCRENEPLVALCARLDVSFGLIASQTLCPVSARCGHMASLIRWHVNEILLGIRFGVSPYHPF
jgi:hypothetical protein